MYSVHTYCIESKREIELGSVGNLLNEMIGTLDIEEQLRLKMLDDLAKLLHEIVIPHLSNNALCNPYTPAEIHHIGDSHVKVLGGVCKGIVEPLWGIDTGSARLVICGSSTGT
jgi:hypothetical protein